MHEAIELALTKPRNLPATPTHNAFIWVVRYNKIADLQSFDRDFAYQSGLRTGTTLNDFLDQRPSRLTRFMLPVIVTSTQNKSFLSPDDLGPNGEPTVL
jgi:hypothetical protein